MDRRTTSAIVVLALAAIVVIAAWLLRADGASAPVAGPPAPVDPAPVAAPEPTAALPGPDSPLPGDEASTAPGAKSATPSETRPHPPRETGDFLVDVARQRAREKEEKALRNWGPKGRVVEAGTGAPIPWKSVTIQVRDPRNPSAVEIRGTDRGATPDGDPGPLSAFDLNGSDLILGDATLSDKPPQTLEYRVVVQAWTFRAASTPWRTLRAEAGEPELVVQLERDLLSTLRAVVRNADGSPFRGHVIVDLDGPEGKYEGVISSNTDAGGLARLPDIPSGEFNVRLRATLPAPERGRPWQPGGLSTGSKLLRLPAGGAVDGEFTVPAWGEIEIAWLDAGGATIESTRGANILLKSASQWVGYSSQPTRVTGLLPGSLEVTLSLPDHRTWKSTVQVVAGQVTKVEAHFEKGEDPK